MLFDTAETRPGLLSQALRKPHNEEQPGVISVVLGTY